MQKYVRNLAALFISLIIRIGYFMKDSTVILMYLGKWSKIGVNKLWLTFYVWAIEFREIFYLNVKNVNLNMCKMVLKIKTYK